jgi:hypothetical protein
MMFVGVAVVAAAMYVAASPASQQGGFASAKSVAALKKQVGSLSKSLKATKKESDAVAGFLADCFLSPNAGVVGVSQFGDTQNQPATFGYHYKDPTNGEQFVTALDADGSATPGAFLQAVDPTCVKAALKHRLKLGSDARRPLLSGRSHS